MGDKELELKIRMAPLIDHLTCAVCMGRLKETHITPCGHRYCEQCIRECINRLRRCPCCNAALQQDQLIKDPQFDALCEAIKKEEAEAEKTYFENIISAAAESAVNLNSHASDGPDLRRLFTPVEEVLKEHLKRSLIAHEDFYQELQQQVRRRRTMVDEELRLTIDSLMTSVGVTEADAERKIVNCQEEARLQKVALDEEMQRCADLVAQAYDRYLSEHIPDLNILPVTVSLSMLNKGIQLTDVRLKPNDSIADIKQFLTDEMSKRGDNLLSFGDNVQFLCFSPFAKKSLYEMARIACDVVEHRATVPDVIVLPHNCLPVMQFGIRPGSEIAIYGTVQCESDVPKKCFSKTFCADDKKSMDYFKCNSCKMNWICRPCMDVCHKDHEIVPYIFNHQPTWACCYCVKKKHCLIQS